MAEDTVLYEMPTVVMKAEPPGPHLRFDKEVVQLRDGIYTLEEDGRGLLVGSWVFDRSQ